MQNVASQGGLKRSPQIVARCRRKHRDAKVMPKRKRVRPWEEKNIVSLTPYYVIFRNALTNLCTAQPNVDELRRARHLMKIVPEQYVRGREVLHQRVDVD
jgi:hypothetical protein